MKRALLLVTVMVVMLASMINADVTTTAVYFENGFDSVTNENCCLPDGSQTPECKAAMQQFADYRVARDTYLKTWTQEDIDRALNLAVRSQAKAWILNNQANHIITDENLTVENAKNALFLLKRATLYATDAIKRGRNVNDLTAKIESNSNAAEARINRKSKKKSKE